MRNEWHDVWADDMTTDVRDEVDIKPDPDALLAELEQAWCTTAAIASELREARSRIAQLEAMVMR